MAVSSAWLQVFLSLFLSLSLSLLVTPQKRAPFHMCFPSTSVLPCGLPTVCTTLRSLGQKLPVTCPSHTSVRGLELKDVCSGAETTLMTCTELCGWSQVTREDGVWGGDELRSCGSRVGWLMGAGDSLFVMATPWVEFSIYRQSRLNLEYMVSHLQASAGIK